MRLHPLCQRFALDVRHHQIRRAVLLEQIQNRHKRRKVRHRVQEAVSPHEPRAVQGKIRRTFGHGLHAAVSRPDSKGARKKLLHGDHPAARGGNQLHGAVGDAERAAAERVAQQIAGVQDGLRRQSKIRLCGSHSSAGGR